MFRIQSNFIWYSISSPQKAPSLIPYTRLSHSAGFPHSQLCLAFPPVRPEFADSFSLHIPQDLDQVHCLHSQFPDPKAPSSVCSALVFSGFNAGLESTWHSEHKPIDKRNQMFIKSLRRTKEHETVTTVESLDSTVIF